MSIYEMNKKLLSFIKEWIDEDCITLYDITKIDKQIQSIYYIKNTSKIYNFILDKSNPLPLATQPTFISDIRDTRHWPPTVN